MRFLELLQAVAFGPVWECLQSSYDLEDRLFDGYQQAFNELLNTAPLEAEDEMLLVVAKLHAEAIGEEGHYYHVFGIQTSDQKRYGLMLVPWEEWLSFQVLEKSIVLYGCVAFVAHSLYDLTYHGFSNEFSKTEIKRIFDSPISPERGNAKRLAEELRCMDERTEEEKQLEEQRWRTAKEANERIIASLLDEADNVPEEDDTSGECQTK